MEAKYFAAVYPVIPKCIRLGRVSTWIVRFFTLGSLQSDESSSAPPGRPELE